MQNFEEQNHIKQAFSLQAIDKVSLTSLYMHASSGVCSLNDTSIKYAIYCGLQDLVQRRMSMCNFYTTSRRFGFSTRGNFFQRQDIKYVSFKNLCFLFTAVKLFYNNRIILRTFSNIKQVPIKQILRHLKMERSRGYFFLYQICEGRKA